MNTDIAIVIVMIGTAVNALLLYIAFTTGVKIKAINDMLTEREVCKNEILLYCLRRCLQDFIADEKFEDAIRCRGLIMELENDLKK